MRLTRFSIVMLILFFISCKAGKVKMKGDCKIFQKDLKTNWVYDEKQKIYTLVENRFTKACLYGLTEEEVITLLGKPSVKYKNMLRYYMHKECYKKPPPICTMIQVIINDKTGKVENVVGGTFGTQ